MNINRSLVFIPLFLIAAVSVGYILYTKQIAEAPVPLPLEVQVKGNDVALAPNVTVAANSNRYTKENRAVHMNLTAENVVWFTNYERVQAGLKPLALEPALNRSSQRKNVDMFTHQYFSHSRDSTPPVGFDFFIDEQRYSFIKIGENLAMGDFSTSAEVVTAWMNSPSHRKNIMDTLYHEIGVGVTSGVMNGKETLLITQHFGDPRDRCPTISVSTKASIETLKKDILELQTIIGEEQQKVNRSTKVLDPNYDSIIAKYNEMVDQYNQSINRMEDLVTKYNKQVQIFDQCLQGRR